MAHGQPRHQRGDRRRRHQRHPHVHIAHDALGLRSQHGGMQDAHDAHQHEQAQARLQQREAVTAAGGKERGVLGKRERPLAPHEQARRSGHRHDGQHACRKRSQQGQHRHQHALHDEPAHDLVHAVRGLGLRHEHLEPRGVEHRQREAAQHAVEHGRHRERQPRHHAGGAQEEPDEQRDHRRNLGQRARAKPPRAHERDRERSGVHREHEVELGHEPDGGGHRPHRRDVGNGNRGLAQTEAERPEGYACKLVRHAISSRLHCTLSCAGQRGRQLENRPQFPARKCH